MMASFKGHAATVRVLLADARVQVNVQTKVSYRAKSLLIGGTAALCIYSIVILIDCLMCYRMGGRRCSGPATKVTPLQCKFCWLMLGWTSILRTRLARAVQ